MKLPSRCSGLFCSQRVRSNEPATGLCRSATSRFGLSALAVGFRSLTGARLRRSVGSAEAFYAPWEPRALLREVPDVWHEALASTGRQLAETFANQRLDRIESAASLKSAARELREAALDWIEHHTERRLHTRTLLETT